MFGALPGVFVPLVPEKHSSSPHRSCVEEDKESVWFIVILLVWLKYQVLSLLPSPKDISDSTPRLFPPSLETAVAHLPLTCFL